MKSYVLLVWLRSLNTSTFTIAILLVVLIILIIAGVLVARKSNKKDEQGSEDAPSNDVSGKTVFVIVGDLSGSLLGIHGLIRDDVDMCLFDMAFMMTQSRMLVQEAQSEEFYEGKDQTIAEWLKEIIEYLKSWGKSGDDKRLLDLNIALALALKDSKTLLGVNPEIWIDWLKTQTDENRVISDLKSIYRKAIYHLNRGNESLYFYIMRYAQQELPNFKCNVPENVKNLFLVPEERQTEFDRFKNSVPNIMSWDDLQKMVEEVKFGEYCKWAEAMMKVDHFDDKDGALNELIKKLSDFFRDPPKPLGKEAVDALYLLISLKDISQFADINPECLVDWLRWRQDPSEVNTYLKELAKLTETYHRRNVREYLYIMEHTRRLFDEFKCEIPDETKGLFVIPEALREQAEALWNHCQETGLDWAGICEGSNNQGPSDQRETKKIKRTSADSADVFLFLKCFQIF